MERFNIIRNALHMYNSVHVSATYTVPSSLLVSSSLAGLKAIIYSALALVFREHPILNVTTKDEDTNEPKWQHVPTIDFDQMVRILDQDPEASPDAWLQKGFEWHVDRTEGIDLPVWRIIIAINEKSLSSPASKTTTKFTLAFYAHHSIADGGSAAAFHTTFLSALNQLITAPSPTTLLQPIISTPRLPLLPSIEEATPLPVSFFFAILLIFKTYIYNPIDALSWTGPPVPATPPATVPICRLSSFSLPPDQVTHLIQACRAERTTLTSLLCVLVARKLGAMLDGEDRLLGG